MTGHALKVIRYMSKAMREEDATGQVAVLTWRLALVWYAEVGAGPARRMERLELAPDVGAA